MSPTPTLLEAEDGRKTRTTAFGNGKQRKPRRARGIRKNRPTEKVPKSKKTLGRLAPKCSRCANHNIAVPVKGHKPFCVYRFCPCELCKATLAKQHSVALQVSVRRELSRLTIESPKLKASRKARNKIYKARNQLGQTAESNASVNLNACNTNGSKPQEKRDEVEAVNSEHSVQDLSADRRSAFSPVPVLRPGSVKASSSIPAGDQPSPAQDVQTNNYFGLKEPYPIPDVREIDMMKTSLMALQGMLQYPLECLPLVYRILKDCNGDYKLAAGKIMESQAEFHTLAILDQIARMNPGYNGNANLSTGLLDLSTTSPASELYNNPYFVAAFVAALVNYPAQAR